QTKNRMFGPLGGFYWALIATNIVTPQLLWFRRVRANIIVVWLLANVINVGMWLERFVIVVISLTRDYLPSSWGTYKATRWDYATYIGTLGLFLTLIFLFVRVLPMISIFEVRALLPQSKVNAPLQENLQA